MKFFTSIALMTVLGIGLACKKNPAHTNRLAAENPVASQLAYSFVGATSYTKSDTIRIKFKNISESVLVVYKPKPVFIEKKVGNEWQKVQILYCPCGASCPPPPAQQLLDLNKEMAFFWTQIENWCVDKVEETRQASTGQYRLRVQYSTSPTNYDRQMAYYEFEIR
ncbi:MAG: hypothetical protein MUE85_17655 [Microscillaceae bacterium]|jgi:hypothetical protein|nr:hypothetical protein [Microscillaceae bacterium]